MGKIFDPFLGIGVFNSDGAMWRRVPRPPTSQVHSATYLPYRFHRGMTRPFFSKDRISHFEIFDRHATDAIKQVKVRVGQGYAVDVQVSIYATPRANCLLSSRTSSLGSLLILQRNSSSECLCLRLGCHSASSTHSTVSQGHPFALGWIKLPAFCFHSVLSRPPSGQIR
jgi:hypothetical protein